MPCSNGSHFGRDYGFDQKPTKVHLESFPRPQWGLELTQRYLPRMHFSSTALVPLAQPLTIVTCSDTVSGALSPLTSFCETYFVLHQAFHSQKHCDWRNPLSDCFTNTEPEQELGTSLQPGVRYLTLGEGWGLAHACLISISHWLA